jgi:hypothetical protein
MKLARREREQATDATITRQMLHVDRACHFYSGWTMYDRREWIWSAEAWELRLRIDSKLARLISDARIVARRMDSQSVREVLARVDTAEHIATCTMRR